MTATDRIVAQLKARRVREGEYTARCPVHQGKSSTSLSIKDAGDRVLIHCFASCQLSDILAAIGLKSAADLFASAKPHAHPHAERQARIRRGIEIWSNRRLIHVCKQLRGIDHRIRLAAKRLAAYEDGRLDRDAAKEELLWTVLAQAYRARAEFEIQFDVLNQRDLQAKYDLFRMLK